MKPGTLRKRIKRQFELCRHAPTCTGAAVLRQTALRQTGYQYLVAGLPKCKSVSAVIVAIGARGITSCIFRPCRVECDHL